MCPFQGANPKTKSSPKVAVPDVGKAKTIVVEEDKAADEAKQQAMGSLSCPVL
jgi:hypothetical protein